MDSNQQLSTSTLLSDSNSNELEKISSPPGIEEDDLNISISIPAAMPSIDISIPPPMPPIDIEMLSLPELTSSPMPSTSSGFGTDVQSIITEPKITAKTTVEEKLMSTTSNMPPIDTTATALTSSVLPPLIVPTPSTSSAILAADAVAATIDLTTPTITPTPTTTTSSLTVCEETATTSSGASTSSSGNKTNDNRVTADKIEVEILPLIYDIIRCVEKDPMDNASKQKESLECSQKILLLERRLDTLRSQIRQLPGIEYNKEEQLERLEQLQNQLKLKQALIKKYKNIEF